MQYSSYRQIGDKKAPYSGLTGNVHLVGEMGAGNMTAPDLVMRPSLKSFGEQAVIFNTAQIITRTTVLM